ncbi:MAG: sulfatase-like hydrolase/transferase [Bacteroidota bacterium]
MTKLRAHPLFWPIGFGLINLGYALLMVLHFGRSPWLMAYLGAGGCCWGMLLSLLLENSFERRRIAQLGTSFFTVGLFSLNLCSWHSWGRPLSWEFLQTGVDQWSFWQAWFYLQSASVWMEVLYLGICLLGLLLIQRPNPGFRLRSSRKPVAVVSCALLLLGGTILADPHGGPWTNFYRPRMFPPPQFTSQTLERAIADQQALAQLPASPLPQRPQVIVIVVDAWRADHLAAYGYERATMPQLSDWLERHPHFQQDWTFSSCAHTACGVPSLLQGAYRHEMGQSGLSFFGYLQQLGYETRAYLSGPHRHIWGMNDAFFRHLDAYEDGSELPQDQQFDDSELVKRVQALPLASADAPIALYLHLMSAHTNSQTDSVFFDFLPQQDFGHWEGAPAGTFDPQWTANAYDNGLRQLDQRLGEILLALEQKGYLDHAWLLLAGDHGEALGEHDIWGHSYHLFPEMTHVPALIVDSDPTYAYQPQLSGQVDVLPTLLDRLGVPIPSHLSGHSWLQPTTGRVLRQQTEYDPQVYGWLTETETGRFQYLYQPDHDQEWLLPLNLPSDSSVFPPINRTEILNHFRQFHKQLPGK